MNENILLKQNYILYTTKILVSIWLYIVQFGKTVHHKQQFLSQHTSNKLIYRMRPKSETYNSCFRGTMQPPSVIVTWSSFPMLLASFLHKSQAISWEEVGSFSCPCCFFAHLWSFCSSETLTQCITGCLVVSEILSTELGSFRHANHHERCAQQPVTIWTGSQF